MERNKSLYLQIEKLAQKHGCTPSQLALAWVFHQGDDVAPIPGESHFVFSTSILFSLIAGNTDIPTTSQQNSHNLPEMIVQIHVLNLPCLFVQILH